VEADKALRGTQPQQYGSVVGDRAESQGFLEYRNGILESLLGHQSAAHAVVGKSIVGTYSDCLFGCLQRFFGVLHLSVRQTHNGVAV
jgi:hypothetical protein